MSRNLYFLQSDNKITFFTIVKFLRERTHLLNAICLSARSSNGMKLLISSQTSMQSVAFRSYEAIPVCRVSNDVTLRTLGAHHVNQVNVVPRWKPSPVRFVASEIRFSSSPPCRARKIRSATPYSRWLWWRHYLTSSFCRQHSEQES